MCNGHLLLYDQVKFGKEKTISDFDSNCIEHTIGEVDCVLIIKFDGSCVMTNCLLIVSLLEFIVAQILFE